MTASTPGKKEEIDRKHGGMLLDVEVEDGIGEEVSIQVKVGRTKSPATKKRYHQITISTPSKRTKSSSSTDIDDQQKGGGGGVGSKSAIGEGRVGNKSSSIAIVQLKGGVRTITTISSGAEEEPMTAEEQLQKLVKKFEMMSVAIAADDDFDVSSIYPYLADSLQLENVFRVDAATLAHAKKNLRLMGSSKMKEFDDKWSKLQEEQIELSLSSKRDDILSNLNILSKQNELMYHQLTILIDAMSKTGKKEEVDESKKHGGMLLDVEVKDGEEVSIQVKIGMTKTITSEVSSATPEIIRTKEIYHHIPISTPPKKTTIKTPGSSPSSSTAIDDQQKGGARTMTTISTGDLDADVVGSEQEILGFETDEEEEEMFRKLKNLST
ncbi:hypothetical protein Q3G72_004034 [Acer saccharum]|nr:hypothetical protein Q3G72_004034 [Acer saccharum]